MFFSLQESLNPIPPKRELRKSYGFKEKVPFRGFRGKKSLLVFLTSLILMGACSKRQQKYKDVFYWNLYTGITSLDPAFARSLANIQACQQIYNGLVQLDDNLNLQPCIAKSWKISDNGLKYTFNLRNDVYYQDNSLFKNGKGRKVNASDFVFSFSRIKDKKTASPGAWIFNEKVDSINPFNAVNDSIFEIKLYKPFTPFLSLLTTIYCSVVPKEIIEHYGKEFREHPVGTGPFQMKYYYEGEKLILHKNPNYFETVKTLDGKTERLPYLKAIDISFIDSKQNEFFSFMQGKLDLVNGIDQSFKDNILTKEGELKEKIKGKFRFEKTPFLNTEYFGFLMDSLPANMNAEQYLKLRKAMNYALDRKKMIRYIRNNIGIPGEYGFVPPSLPPFGNKKEYYPYNPGMASQLLREAGFPQGKDLPVIKLTTTANYLDLSIYVQHAMQEAGIPVQIENVPSPTLSEYKSKGKSIFFRGSWVADYPDAENYLSIFYSKNRPPNGPNYFHFNNAEFDKNYETIFQKDEFRPPGLNYVVMQEILMEEAPVLILYYDETVRLINNRIEGLHANGVNSVDLRRVKIK